MRKPKKGDYLCQMLNCRYQNMYFDGKDWYEPFGSIVEHGQVRRYTKIPNKWTEYDL